LKKYSETLEITIHAGTVWSELANTIQAHLRPEHSRILLSFGWEAHMMVTWKPQNDIFIFEALHHAIDQTGLPYNKFYFCQGNAFIAECYDRWCELTNQTQRVAGVFHHHSDFFAKFMETKRQLPNIDFYKLCRKKLKPKYFSSLNGRHSSARVNTLLHLYDHDLVDRGICTFIFMPDVVERIAAHRPDVAALLPMSLEPTGQFVNYRQPPDTYWFKNETVYYSVYANSYYDMVAETIHHLDIDLSCFPDTDRLSINHNPGPGWTHNAFFSEKLVRNICNKRPFLLIGGQHSLKALHRLGFLTFDGLLFNESYDSIADPIERLNAVLAENLRVVNTHSLEELHSIVYSSQMEHILEHNYQLAVQYSKQSAVDLLNEHLTTP
jgi:hypothetical protein